MLYFALAGRVVAHDCGVLGQYACAHCGRVGAWRLLTVRVWLLVFSIPLVPCRARYWAICEHCDYGHRIESDHFRLIRPWAELNRRYLAHEVSARQYGIYYRSVHCLLPGLGETWTYLEENSPATNEKPDGVITRRDDVRGILAASFPRENVNRN